MAIRNIRVIGDEVLQKTCKEVKEMTPKIRTLIHDMLDTMYEAQGVGLAAPQVGILKRIVVIDVGEGLWELINPKIVEKSGNVLGLEGCLSVPEKQGYVYRAQKILVWAQNRYGEPFEFEAENYFARACQHEIDHLNGVLYVDKLAHPTEQELAEMDEE